MGLAGRKQKQRIPADPRNLSWADDASRFGPLYLSKFGWDASQGLGSSGDGIKTHITVQQKLDTMGIGTQHQNDPNGIAWKQNRDFEALLKRLNEGVDGEDAKKEDSSSWEEKIEERLMDEPSVASAKKRRRGNTGKPDTSERTGKKRKKAKKTPPKSRSDLSSVLVMGPIPDPASPSDSHSEPIPRARPMAHRARMRVAKRIAGKSASAISEILGIAPSSSVSTSMSTPAPNASSQSTPEPRPSSHSPDNLKTSTKSVADYFKEKLLSRAAASSPPPPLLATTELSSPTPGLGATRLGSGLPGVFSPDNESEGPRRGRGSQAPVSPPSSKVAEFDGGGDANSQGVLTEKLPQKAERTAKKKKRREAEASQPIPEKETRDIQEWTVQYQRRRRRDTLDRSLAELMKNEHEGGCS